jgi:Ca2+-binding EF-hand superfamily protein
VEEFTSVMTSFSQGKIQEEELNGMVNALDADGTGWISLEEFVTYMQPTQVCSEW